MNSRFIIGLLSLCCLPALAQPAANPTWPFPVPCRVHDGTNKDLFVMTLGPVQTPLADGTFDPLKDEVTLKDGTIESNYYRDVLGLKYYQPLDKSRFPLPPSGWCTWYYYYSRINATEVKRNAEWLAANLKEYGAQYVQIDDGWQGAGGRDGGRDWTQVNPQRFPDGMADVAAYIKSVGLTPGLWLAPHGQSNDKVVRQLPGVFLLRTNGASASDTWEGRYLLDPTTPESRNYLGALFRRLAGWGYEYFKIDGQPIVVDEYRTKSQFMKSPSPAAADLYRGTLRVIREAIGPDRYLLGCWGIPTEGAGIMNGSRTGGDIVLGWGGFHVALRATLEHYYLHNIMWYCDPDVLLVRSPLTLDQARVWATLQGLTGQALMSSDRLMDLSDARVELLRRVYPAVDIRPLDLFPARRNKRIWDLKINHLNRQYDVVGVFNFNNTKAERTLVSWRDLGIPADKPVHVFDFWNREYLGVWPEGITVEAAPASCRLLTLLPAGDRIQLISTSRHVTQGWVDLLKLTQNEAGDTFQGLSKVIRNDPYELRFVFPPGTNFVVQSAVARGPAGEQLPVSSSSHQGWAVVRLTSPQTGQIDWQVHFAHGDFYDYPVAEPNGLWAERVGLDGINLHWREQYYLNAGYQVSLNGQVVGRTPEAMFPLRGLDPQSAYTAEVRTVWDNGKTSPRRAELKFSLASLLPAELSLPELEPVHSTARWRGIEADEAVSTAPLLLGGTRCENGLAAPPNSEIEFEIKGLYDRFVARVGLDDSSPGEPELEFLLLGDGRELWRSGLLHKADGPKPVMADIAGVQRLVLQIKGPTGRRNRLQADWAEPKLVKAGPHTP